MKSLNSVNQTKAREVVCLIINRARIASRSRRGYQASQRLAQQTGNINLEYCRERATQTLAVRLEAMSCAREVAAAFLGGEVFPSKIRQLLRSAQALR